MLTKRQRLDEILRRLDAAPCASSEAEAYQLLCDTIAAVEDEHSGVPNIPDNWKRDQRIYPPQADFSIRGMIPVVVVYKALRHNILVGTTGALTIVVRETERIELAKAACDGTKLTP